MHGGRTQTLQEQVRPLQPPIVAPPSATAALAAAALAAAALAAAALALAALAATCAAVTSTAVTSAAAHAIAAQADAAVRSVDGSTTARTPPLRQLIRRHAGGCVHNATRDEALARCNEHGARLRTREELPPPHTDAKTEDGEQVQTWNMVLNGLNPGVLLA